MGFNGYLSKNSNKAFNETANIAILFRLVHVNYIEFYIFT